MEIQRDNEFNSRCRQAYKIHSRHSMKVTQVNNLEEN